MSSLRRLFLLATLAALGGASVPLVPTAEAAPKETTFEQPGVIELLRPMDLLGDGATAAEMWLLALNGDGTPVVGMRWKMIVTGGTATELVDQGNGLYKFSFVPNKTDSPTTATFATKGKLPSKLFTDKTWTVPVSVPRSRAMAVKANPAQLTFGVDKTVGVAFTFTGGDPRTFANIKLQGNVSAGTFANVTNLGGGSFTGLYTAPTQAVPQMALLTFVDGGDPMRTYGSLAIPLSAKMTPAVSGPKGSRVILKVGGREFGPVPVDSKGKAKIPVEVPPGVSVATQVTVAADGSLSEAPLDLKIPETRRILLFPTAAGIPSDSRLGIPVRAMVVTPDGRPDDGASVSFAVSAGSVGSVTHEGGGIYMATYTPPAGNASVAATLTAKLEGGSAVQVDTRPLALVPVRAGALSLAANPPVTPKTATTLTLDARVTGPDGAGLAGRTLAFSANGAKLAGVEDKGGGAYVATFNTTSKGAAEVTASVAAATTGNQLAQLLVVPSREHLPADGLSSAMITLATLDEFGYPVPNVEVSLSVVSGDGSLPTTATTNASGIAQVYYTAGRKNGFVGIDASAGDQYGGTSLVQAPVELKIPDLPVAASAPIRAMVGEWTGSTTTLWVERE